MGDDFWKNIDEAWQAEKKERKARAAEQKHKLKVKAERERFYQEAEEYQNKCNQAYSSGGGSSYTAHDGDGASLYEKFNAKNFSAYRDEIANFYGAHNDGYSGQSSDRGLNRGLGCGPTQKIHINEKNNLHHFDASAPRIRVRLQNSWTSSQSNQQAVSTQPTFNLSGRAINGGRSNGGSNLGGRF